MKVTPVPESKKRTIKPGIRKPGPLWTKATKEAIVKQQARTHTTPLGAEWGRRRTQPKLITGKGVCRKTTPSFEEALAAIDVTGEPKVRKSVPISVVIPKVRKRVASPPAVHETPTTSIGPLPGIMALLTETFTRTNDSEPTAPVEPVVPVLPAAYVRVSPPMPTKIGVIQRILDAGIKRSGPWKSIVLCDGEPLEIGVKKLKRLLKQAGFAKDM